MITIVFIICQITFLNEGNVVHGSLYNKNLTDFNFAAVGDWGCTPITNDTVNNIVDKEPELVLGLGDYSYENSANCWLNLVAPLDDKMKITIGNHEHRYYQEENNTSYFSPSLLEEYMTHFNLSKQYYSFNHQNVHFVAMSTEVAFDSNSDQYKFVAADLSNASQNPNIDWIIVFYHRLAYSSPAVLGTIPMLRDTYHPLFEKFNVDMVLQGHSHNYQRSFPIIHNNTTPAKPSITDNAKFNYDDPKGQIYAIVGTGGFDEIHNFTGPAAKYIVTQFNAYGFLDLNVIQNGSTLEGKFYDNKDKIRDHFSITKPINKQDNLPIPSSSKPKLMPSVNSTFEIQTVFEGFQSPTDMDFINPKYPTDIIVLEKNTGTVQRIVDGHLQDNPLVKVNVSNKNERGLLGVALSESGNSSKYVYLYYTEANQSSEDCIKPDCPPGIDPIGNRLYRYELPPNGTKLLNPKLLLDLPAVPGPAHNGGKIIFGPDNTIFLIIGDLMGHKTKAQNYEKGAEPDATGGVLRIDQEGQPLNGGYIGAEYPLNLYYAYGIRNSFGIDFDPLSGNLWDSENGPDFADEINFISPGFNSGWKDVQGIWEHKGGKPQNVSLYPDKLVDFNGKGRYSEPEFTFFNTVGVTAIKFFDSDKFGLEYENDLFVGDIKNGNVYHFNLETDRRNLVLDGSLSDKIANTTEELDKVKFAEGFSGISDLEVGPDGHLYVLSYGDGTIYRIVRM